MCLLVFSHPHILIPSGSCVLVDICASLHPHILRFMCACWHPRILTSLYAEVHLCLPTSLHPHILIYSDSCVFGCILTCSQPYVMFPGFCVFACILASSRPHTLRFICTCWYPCILISSDSCVFPFILASSHPHFFFIYNTNLHFANKYLHKCTSKKKSYNLQYNKRIKPTQYWTQH